MEFLIPIAIYSFPVHLSQILRFAPRLRHATSGRAGGQGEGGQFLSPKTKVLSPKP